MTPAIVILAERSRPLAVRIAEAVDGEVVLVSGIADMARLFAHGRPLIGVCAAGILIRAVAPHLADKHGEPPVLAVDEAGRHVVPLLGGHHGANRLAGRIAGTIDATAAVTTASDAALGLALDEPPAGWRLAATDNLKRVTAALLEGEAIAIDDPVGHGGWLRVPRRADARLRITIGHQSGLAGDLVYHPPVLALGVGCERGAEPDELRELALTTLVQQGLARGAVACVVSLDLKAAEPAVHALARHLDVPARFFTIGELKEEMPRLLSPSVAVEAEVGVAGVAEAAALAAAGSRGELIVPKRKSRRCTVAIALAPEPLDLAAIGRARGRLCVVGIGPGDCASRIGAATVALREAEEVVGYGLYCDLVGDLIAGKTVHRFPLGAETERCRLALERAATGRTVALVSSGDPGIYAMAALVTELLEHSEDRAVQRVALDIVPGISAMQALAARLGAPLGHDFCAVSLSDLLTPMAMIERRLQVAAAGDFVTALYNPVSERRRSAIGLARKIMLEHRPSETPVTIGRALGRAEEEVSVVPLEALSADHLDMLSIAIIGSSTTRTFSRPDGRTIAYTPRGYGVS